MIQDQQNRVRNVERIAIRATTWIGSPASLVVHTILFILSFLLIIIGFPTDKVLLVLTTIVSLEAIYLSIFIQMSVNRSNRRLVAVRKDLEEIQEDVEDIQEDVEEIQEGVESIEKDVDEIQKDVEEIQEDVEGIEKDVDEIQGDIEGLEEDVEDISEDTLATAVAERARDQDMLVRVESALTVLMQELQDLKAKQNPVKNSTKKPATKVTKK